MATDADAIVIGGGAAGLAAARGLAGGSLRVILLEARDRIGGRAWSRSLAGSRFPAELGAEFVHGPALETMMLLREAGLAAVDTGGDAWTLQRGKLKRDRREFLEAARIFEQALKLHSDESVEDFLQRFEADTRMYKTAEAARAFVEGFDAADPGVASARAIAQEWCSGVDFSSARPIGGYGNLFHFLHEACIAAGVDVRLSTTVRRISWRCRNAIVEASDADGGLQRYTAKAAIVTVPAALLGDHDDGAHIAFDPKLPLSKREALEYIEMGHVVKVVLTFRNPFWEQVSDGRYRDGAFFRADGQPFATYWTQLPIRGEIVAAWAAGPKAVALSGLAHDDLVELALDGLGALLGESQTVRNEFEAGLTHDWARDPFARGAYSYVAVGGAGARCALAASVENTLFFAGEATSTDGQSGTVNGALVTGARAAAEIFDA